MAEKNDMSWAGLAHVIYENHFRRRISAWGKKPDTLEVSENKPSESLSIESNIEPKLLLLDHSKKLISYSNYAQQRGITIASRLDLSTN